MCTRQNPLFLSFRTRVLALQKDFNIKTLFVPQFISLSLSLLSCSVATIISFYIVFHHHHHHHHQCFFAGFGDGFICAHREECEEKEYEEKECRSLSARCYYAFHSNKNKKYQQIMLLWNPPGPCQQLQLLSVGSKWISYGSVPKMFAFGGVTIAQKSTKG